LAAQRTVRCNRLLTAPRHAHAQFTALFTSAAIFASSAAVNSFSAKEVGHLRLVRGAARLRLQLSCALLHRGTFLVVAVRLRHALSSAPPNIACRQTSAGEVRSGLSGCAAD
jgi:hypothetical protein